MPVESLQLSISVCKFFVSLSLLCARAFFFLFVSIYFSFPVKFSASRQEVQPGPPKPSVTQQNLEPWNIKMAPPYFLRLELCTENFAFQSKRVRCLKESAVFRLFTRGGTTERELNGLGFHTFFSMPAFDFLVSQNCQKGEFSKS